MGIRLAEKEEFYICGIVIKTDVLSKSKNVDAIYNHGALLSEVKEIQEGYYGIQWYENNNKVFNYMLGKEVAPDFTPPNPLEIRKITASKYLVCEVSVTANITEVWTEFFYNSIKGLGYKRDNFKEYFEYYPYGLKSDCELWVPVIRQ